MLFFKIYYHIKSEIKKMLYKIIYGKKIKFGKKVTFRKGFSLIIEKNANVVIGDGCFFNNYCSINAMDNIVIGNNCLFGENVKIYDHNHIFNQSNKLIKEQGFKKNRIKIGNNCWICSNVVILMGVKIGNCVVVGAGSVIERNIQNNQLVCLKRENQYCEIKRINHD